MKLSPSIFRVRARSFLPLAALVAVGCSRSAEGVEASGADLAASGFDEACSPPVRSEDGKYLFLDLCAADAAGTGRVVRVDVATSTIAPISTYAAVDRIGRLGTKGDRVFFEIRHAVDGVGRATAGVSVEVHDVGLATVSRKIDMQAVDGVEGTFGALGLLMVTADGTSVAFAADKTTALSHRLFVAPVAGAAAPVALDVGSPSGALRWSAAGGTFVGHLADATLWTGETLLVVETGGASGATLTGPRHVGVSSFAFGQGGTRPQEPFDGTRVLGFKQTEATGAVVATVDPKTGEETVLDTAPVLAIVTDLGPDVLYSRVTHAEGSSDYVRELVKQPRVGGAKTSLLTEKGPSFDAVRYGFDPLAVSKTGAFGLFGTRTPAGANERWLVKLDGSAPPTAIADTVTVVAQVGNFVLLADSPAATPPAPAAPVFQVIDLTTGASRALGPVANAASATLAGDGSVVQLQDCETDSGPGTRVLRSSGTDDATPPTACTWMPWASIPLAAENSGALVFYSSSGPFPDYRYDVGVVNP